MDKADTLKNSILFNHLNLEEIAKIAFIAVEKEYEKDSVILSENMSSLALYVIQDGCVEILKVIGPEKTKTLMTLMNGECFGELSLFDDAPHSAIVKATDDTKLLVIEKSRFDELVERDPELTIKILKKLIKILSYRLRQSNEQMLNVMAWSIYAQQTK